MEPKYIIFFGGVAVLVPLAVVMGSTMPRLRDAAFFVGIVATIFAESFNINFVTQPLYRGTSRGIEISIIDIMSIILLFSVVISPGSEPRRLLKMGSLWFLLAFLAYCAVSVVMIEPRLFGVYELVKMVRALIMFMAGALYVRSEHEVRVFTLALATAVFLLAGYGFFQRYWQHQMRISSFLKHPNNMSMYCCTAGPILIAMAMSNLPRRYRIIAGVAALAAGGATVLTISRTGVVAYLLVALGTFASCLTGRFGPKHWGAIAFVMLIVVGGVAKSWDSVMRRMESRSLTEEYLTDDKGRGMYFRLGALVIQDYFFGVGLNNWSYVVTEKYYPVLGLDSSPYPIEITGTTIETMDSYDEREMEHEIAPPAHNLAVLVIGEVGIPGFILFWLIWARWYQMSLTFWFKRNASVISRFGVGAFFAFTGCFLTNLTEAGFRQSGIYILVHVIAGVLAALHFARKTQRTAPVRFMPARMGLPAPDRQRAAPRPPRRVPAVYR